MRILALDRSCSALHTWCTVVITLPYDVGVDFHVFGYPSLGEYRTIACQQPSKLFFWESNVSFSAVGRYYLE
jgi:hypothetical protein